MAIGVQVTFDCADPAALGAFWASALGYEVQPPPPGFDSWPAFLSAQGIPESEWTAFNALVDPDGKGPRLFLQRVPEGKTAKNRVHLDVNVGGGHDTPAEERRRLVDAAVDRLVGDGATHVRTIEQHGERWAVMQDPEGNEFCLQ